MICSPSVNSWRPPQSFPPLARQRVGCSARVHRRRRGASRRTRRTSAQIGPTPEISQSSAAGNSCRVCLRLSWVCAALRKACCIFLLHKRVWIGTCGVSVACDSNRDVQRPRRRGSRIRWVSGKEGRRYLSRSCTPWAPNCPSNPPHKPRVPRVFKS